MTGEAFEKIAAGLRDAIDFADGDTARSRIARRPVEVPDVGRIRHRLGLTQVAFADRYGLPVATVRNWEQGRTKPDPAAIGLLRMIERVPETVAEVLNGD